MLPEPVEAVLDIVSAIPPGRVLSYGDVAALVGRGGPRQVGRVLAEYGSLTSWWRVVRVDGTLPEPLRARAQARYGEEATPTRGDGVDMSLARWPGRDCGPAAGAVGGG